MKPVVKKETKVKVVKHQMRKDKNGVQQWESQAFRAGKAGEVPKTGSHRARLEVARALGKADATAFMNTKAKKGVAQAQGTARAKKNPKTPAGGK